MYDQTAVGDLRPTAQPEQICNAGFSLRHALELWHISYLEFDAVCKSDAEQATSGACSLDLLMGRIFFAATSIYLSGIFDYEMPYWQDLGISVPSLSEAQIQTHLHSILSLVQRSFDATNLSPLLFLLPLRIAGARARAKFQQDWIKDLLARVGDGYAVGSAFTAELNELWVDRAASTHPL